MKSRATRQLRCTRTKRWPNSPSSLVSDSSSRYSRAEVRMVMYLSSGLQIHDLVERNEHDARSLGNREESPRRRRKLRQLFHRQGLQPRHFLQCAEERWTRTGFMR
jgi:hypothetical protein